MENIVVSLGGSVIFSDTNPDFIKKIAEIIDTLSVNYRLYLVVGGGKTAREYIKLGRKLIIPENTLDEIGIAITRVNAKFFASLLDKANKIIPISTDEAVEVDTPIVIMGGTTPGHSTDQVGAELAVKTKASRFIIATNVDGIFDKDPNSYKDAKHLPYIYIEDMIQKYGIEWEEAGKNIIVDGPALRLIHEGRIPTFVVNGTKLAELEKAIENKQFYGTRILFK